MTLLRRADIRVAGGAADELVLALPDGEVLSVALRIEARSPSRQRMAEIAAVVGAKRVLYLVAEPSASLLDAAMSGQVDVVATQPELVVFRGQTYLPADQFTDAHLPVGRARWGRWAVDRILMLAESSMTQRAIADAAGISQQAVSKVLRGHPSATSTSGGWIAGSVPEMLDRWATEYPGPGGILSGWYHLDSVKQQAGLAITVAHELGVEALATGDVAADTYSPWRLPGGAAIYTAEMIDLSVAGFVPAGPNESTLGARVPRDPTVWPVARWYADCASRDGSLLVDPVLAYWDLLRAPGADVVEAANRLREAIVNGSLSV